MRAVVVSTLLLALAAGPAAASGCLIAGEVPATLRVVGSNAGVPDSSGLFVVRVLTADSNPCHPDGIVLDLSACTDLVLCDPGIPGQTVSCDTRRIAVTSDLDGYARFLVTGEGLNRGGAAGPGARAGRLLSFNGTVELARFTVTILDQDGAVGGPGLGASDVVALLRDLGTGTYFGRSDLDGDGVVDVSDLSVMLEALGTGRSDEGCGATACP